MLILLPVKEQYPIGTGWCGRMAKTGSYIKLDRGLKKNTMWLEKPFSKGQAWVDLLLLAQGVNRDKEYRGKIQRMKPGIVYTSILYLSNRWGWYRAKVYRFLETLIDLGMVEIQGWTRNDTRNDTQNSTKNSTTNGTIISIVNWASYQDCDTNNSTNNDTPNDTLNDTPNDTHNIKQYRESNTEKANRKKPPKSPKGDLSPSGVKRGTDEFRNQSHVLLKQDEGTVDDIPVRYREQFKTFADYWGYRNQ